MESPGEGHFNLEAKPPRPCGPGRPPSRSRNITAQCSFRRRCTVGSRLARMKYVREYSRHAGIALATTARYSRWYRTPARTAISGRVRTSTGHLLKIALKATENPPNRDELELSCRAENDLVSQSLDLTTMLVLVLWVLSKAAQDFTVLNGRFIHSFLFLMNLDAPTTK